MNERPIAKWDLVRVVRWPCCGAGLGMIDQVTGIEPPYESSPYADGSARCGPCGARHQSYGDLAITERGHVWPTAWLKRIPPLSELEDERREEDITA